MARWGSSLAAELILCADALFVVVLTSKLLSGERNLTLIPDVRTTSTSPPMNHSG